MKYSFDQFFIIGKNINEVISSKDVSKNIAETLQKRIMKFLSQIESDREYINIDQPTQKFKADIEHICDYLNNIPENEAQKQIKGNYEQIFSNANRWSELSQKRGAKLAHKKNVEGQELIYSFADGFNMWHLTTKDQLKIEGNKMGHCVGDFNLKTGIIYSLRDKDNEPHVTLELNMKNQIKQIKGKQDRAPIEKYQSLVIEFIEKFSLEVIGDGGNIGFVKFNEKYYNPQKDKWKRTYKEVITPLQNKKFEEIRKRIKKDENGELLIEGNIGLSNSYLKKLPEWLKYVKIMGDFDCSYNQLTSLKGAPRHVDGNFDCSDNQLTSLEGAPKYVGGDFYCHDNQLTSLEGTPEQVDGDFYCHDNQLTSLEGTPEQVDGDFYCSYNQLTSLEGAPEHVEGNFDCSFNQLTSLKGAPEYVDGNFDCSDNQLTSLEGAPERVGGVFDCRESQLTSLEGAPKYVGGDFYCGGNQFTSLEGAPEYVGGGIVRDIL